MHTALNILANALGAALVVGFAFAFLMVMP
jgi:hypothetical protein